jgi:hypothetical protein
VKEERLTRNILALTLSLLITLSLVLTACTTDKTPTPGTSSPTTVGGGDWWDKFGKPEYGGELIFRVSDHSYSDFDPANFMLHSSSADSNYKTKAKLLVKVLVLPFILHGLPPPGNSKLSQS